MTRHFLSIDDLTAEEQEDLLQLAAKVKSSPGDYAAALEGTAAALIFEKPSTRTRVSFEVAVASMGGHPLALSSSELPLGRGETIEDTGRVCTLVSEEMAEPVHFDHHCGQASYVVCVDPVDEVSPVVRPTRRCCLSWNS